MQAMLWQSALDSALAPTAPEGSDEAYTPRWVIDAARLVLGEIDLDPASCPEAQAVVAARRYFTQAENGLAHPWHGRVWLNPPYSDSLPWVRKAVAHWKEGEITGLLLLRGDTGTAYSQLLARVAPACCWIGRLDFLPVRRDPKGRRQSPDFACLLWYLGADVARFANVFAPHGAIR